MTHISHQGIYVHARFSYQRVQILLHYTKSSIWYVGGSRRLRYLILIFPKILISSYKNSAISSPSMFTNNSSYTFGSLQKSRRACAQAGSGSRRARSSDFSKWVWTDESRRPVICPWLMVRLDGALLTPGRCKDARLSFFFGICQVLIAMLRIGLAKYRNTILKFDSCIFICCEYLRVP